MWPDVEGMQTGMSEKDVKLIYMFFFNALGKLLKEHLKVYLYSGRKCTTLRGIIMQQK
jgi:hypothetical protein